MEQPESVSWNRESIRATQELIDRIDMMAAADEEVGEEHEEDVQEEVEV